MLGDMTREIREYEEIEYREKREYREVENREIREYAKEIRKRDRLKL